MNRCRKRDAEEELPLRQIFDDVCRTVDATESSMYKRRRTAMRSLPTDPRDADAAITVSRFASLGDSPFYRGSVNTGDGDTALIFASDGQLDLLRSCRLVYVDATCRRCLRYFISYLRSSSSTPITRFRCCTLS